MSDRSESIFQMYMSKDKVHRKNSCWSWTNPYTTTWVRPHAVSNAKYYHNRLIAPPPTKRLHAHHADAGGQLPPASTYLLMSEALKQQGRGDTSAALHPCLFHAFVLDQGSGLVYFPKNFIKFFRFSVTSNL